MKKIMLFSLGFFVFGLFNININLVSADYIAGCTTTSLYSSTTGQSCNNTTSIFGCSSGFLFSPITGQACSTSTITTTPPTTNLVFTRDLSARLKSTGSDVKILQQYLKDEGYLSGKVDGKFGKVTGRAVGDIQEDNDLTRTEIVDEATRALLNNLVGGIVTTPPVPTVCPAGGCNQNYPTVSISGVSGPQTLSVNQQGTWTVKASSVGVGNLSYSVVWGDEVGGYLNAVSGSSVLPQQLATFAHSYSQSGNYTPTFIVSLGESGIYAKTSISVNVGDVILPTVPNITILSPQNNSSSNIVPSVVTWTKFSPMSVSGEYYIELKAVNTSGYSFGQVIGSANRTNAAAGCSTSTVCSFSLLSIYPQGINPNGTYSVVVTAREQNNVVISNSASSTFTINGTSISSVTVLSPNGGETWTQGTKQTISWNDAQNISTHEIKLVPYYAPCTSDRCPMYAYQKPYTITNTQGSSYNWTVGDVWDKGVGPFDGSYTIQVCRTGTDVCDSSDSYFKITSGTTTTPTITLSLDSSTPPSANLLPGQNNVSFASVRLTAGSVDVTGIAYFQVLSESANMSNYIKNVRIYDGSTQLGVAQDFPVNNSSISFTINNIAVPAYSSKIITIKADVISSPSTGQINLGIGGLSSDVPNLSHLGLPVYGNMMTIGSNTSITAYSASIVGSQTTYTPGQTIKFSVEGIDSNENPGTPSKGFNVQAWMQTVDPVEAVIINGVYQSVNADYNYNTSDWDVVMTAPSDSSKTYKIETSFYCSNSSAGCSNGQINSLFTFNLPVAAIPVLEINSAFALEHLKVGQSYYAEISAISGNDSYTWVYDGTLPPGLSTNQNRTTSCGGLATCKAPWTISGTPTTAGTYDFNLTVISGTQKANKQFSLTVDPATITPDQVSCTPFGFDATTGFRCGCTSILGWSSVTGESCATSSPYRQGCISFAGFSLVDGQSCAMSSPTISSISKFGLQASALSAFSDATTTPVTTTNTKVVVAEEKFYFTQFLELGSYGNEVMELQKYLSKMGYDVGNIDKVFGSKLKGAVINFQTANKLKADGIVGYEVRTLLNK